MKNRLRLVLILYAIALPLAFTEAQTIFISTIEQLQAIGTDIDKPLSGDYELANNINASITANWNSGAGFMPIGNEANPFVGTFNGAGYEITNLYIYRAAIEGVGLFGRLSAPAVIENLTITAADITGAARTGIVVGGGQASSGSVITIRNCQTAGEVKSITGDDTGGIAGFFINGSISDCHSTARVAGKYNVGGIVGRLEAAQTSLVRSFATGNVSGSFSVGGLVGLLKSASIEDCYAVASVECADVWNDPPSGGIVGSIENSGFVGKCYFSGDVANIRNAGAFAGINNGTIADCFYCIDNITDQALKTIAVKQGSSGGVEGKTAEQLSQIATYTNWDIALQEDHQQEVWWIKESSTFARLRYESLGASILLASPADLQALQSSKVAFSANISAGELIITDVILTVSGVEYATSGLSESGEYYWESEVRGIAEGQHWWQLTVYADFNSEQIITTSAVRNFEVDYSLPPQPIYYTPQPASAMVIIDDDGAQGVYTKLLPVAQQYDIPLSPAILIKYDAMQPHIPPVIPEWGWASMTIAQVVEMSQAGHSIISHGTMHTSHGRIISSNPFTAGSLVLDGGSTNFNGRFSHLHATTNAGRGLTGIEVEIWERDNESIRETIYVVSGGRSSRYDSSNPNSPNAWDIEPITIFSPLVNSYTNPVAEMTVAETERICLEVHNGFVAAGLPIPRHYVFPFNDYPAPPQLNKMFEYFDTLHHDNRLKVYSAPLRENGDNPFLLTRELLDNITDESVIDSIIDRILDYKGLGFVYVHADYGDPPLYEYMVSSATARGLEIIGFNEAWEKYRYRLANVYPALNQQVDLQAGTVELTLEVIESTESDSVQVRFWNVSNPQSPVLIDTALISSGQTATANFNIEQDKQYQWTAEISILTQEGEESNWTTDTFLFNTTQNPTGDINSDGIVDELDLALFASNWLFLLPLGQISRSDFNEDGFIDMIDYSTIVSNWLDEK